jgi:hypothetical protein
VAALAARAELDLRSGREELTVGAAWLVEGLAEGTAGLDPAAALGELDALTERVANERASVLAGARVVRGAAARAAV